MQDQDKQATSPPQFKASPPNVSIVHESQDTGDIEATKAMLELYTQADGFHCPRCAFTTSNPEEAVSHLADEINKALAHLKK